MAVFDDEDEYETLRRNISYRSHVTPAEAEYDTLRCPILIRSHATHENGNQIIKF